MPQQLLPYWNALKRWWWLPIISVILAGVGAYFYWRSQPPVYQARIALIVGNSAQSINPDAQQLGIERTLATFYGEMTRRQPITQAVIERLGLQPMTPEQLGESIETRVVYDAQILEIYVYNFDPQLAATLADAIAAELIKQSPSASVQDEETEAFVNARLEELQKQIDQVDKQLIDLNAKISQMTSASELAEAQATAKELESLKQSYTETYAQLLTSINRRDVNSLSIIEPASAPTRPVSIGLTATLLIALAGGLALSIAAIVVLEYADDVLHWGDAPFALSLPVLGVVPAWHDGERPLILSSFPNSLEADALRSLRARISLGDEKSDVRRITITSPAPNDGKSFTAVNLAVAAAASDLRTILIDGDLRLGNLHKYFGCNPEPGLSDLLRHSGRGRTPPDSLIQSTPIENLYLIAIGRPVLDPASLLSAAKLEALTNALLLNVDLIVIDTPPVGVGPDATLLAAASDAVVLVASVDRTRRRMAIKAITLLERYNLLGLIFNRVALKRTLGEYHQYYSQPVQSDGLLARLKRMPSTLAQRLRPALRSPAERLPTTAPGASRDSSLPDAYGEEIGAPAPELSLPAANGHEAAIPIAGQPDLQNMAEHLWEAIDAADKDDTIIMTTAEAAERLNTSEETVRGWCAAGRLPAVRIGKQWLVTGLTLKEAWPAEEGDAASRARP